MKKYKVKSSPSQRGVYLKKSIARNRGRAKFVGILYLFATIALAGVACLPLMTAPNAPLGVTALINAFVSIGATTFTTSAGIITVINAVLYTVLLLALVINVLKAISKLGWLFKRKASRTYGFNRNAYAMEDLGNLFSGSFAAIISVHFLIAVICGEYTVSPYLLILLGAGLVLHFFLGLVGGKIRYYANQDGDVVEQKREVGRFAPFFRNLLQVVATFTMMYFFLKTSTIDDCLAPLFVENSFGKYVTSNLTAWISILLQVFTMIWMFVLVKHATGTTEYGIEGPYGAGMKNFRVFSFFVFLTAGATCVCRYLFGEVAFASFVLSIVKFVGENVDVGSIIIASIALFMFIVELIMRNRPRRPYEEDVSEAIAPAPVETPTAHPDSPYYNEPEKEELSLDEDNDPFLSEQEEFEDVSEPEQLEVNCPNCGQALLIDGSATYHRCPACGKVFQIRKVTKDVII